MKKLSKNQMFTVIPTAVMIIFSVIVGISTRLSYNKNIQCLPENNESVVMFFSTNIPEQNYDLLWDSDIIVKAVAEDIGIFTMERTRTRLKVLDVYKGELSVDDEFILWQNSRFEYAGPSMNVPAIRTYELSNIILPNKEYIIFAKQKPASQVYLKYSEKLSLIPEYISPTRPLYSYEDVVNSASCYYFMLEDTKVGIISDGTDGLYTKYSSVADCEILCPSVELVEKYEMLKTKVMQRIENDFS